MARPRSQAAREKMLAAATELIFSAGVGAFTIDEVARRSGVAKTTIYRHFPNRNELLIAAIDAGMSVPVTPDNGLLRDDLLEFLASVLPIFQDSALRLVNLEVMVASARDRELGHLFASMLDARMGPLMTIFQRGKTRGEISADMEFDTAFEIIEGPFILRSLFQPEALEDIDLESLVDRMLIALKS